MLNHAITMANLSDNWIMSTRIWKEETGLLSYSTLSLNILRRYGVWESGTVKDMLKIWIELSVE